MALDAAAVWHLARELGFGELDKLARSAGVMSVTQISVYQADAGLRHSVARAIAYQHGVGKMQVVYEGFNRHKPLLLDLPSERLDALSSALIRARFDRLQDEGDISPWTRKLWLVQRAAGSFQHGIVLRPETARSPYRDIVAAVRQNLGAAVRDLPPKG